MNMFGATLNRPRSRRRPRPRFWGVAGPSTTERPRARIEGSLEPLDETVFEDEDDDENEDENEDD